MPDMITARSLIEPTELEFRSGVASLEQLQADRRELLTKHAKLIALHGPFGHYDDHRKAFVEALKVKARDELTRENPAKKPTEDQITAAAYGSEAYQTFLDEHLGEKIEWLTVQDELDALNERIMSRNTELSVYGKEASLAR